MNKARLADFDSVDLKDRRKRALATNLHRLALRANMQQSEISAATGISRDNISNYFLGKVVPTSDNASKLASFFGVTVEDLLTPQGTQAPANTDTQAPFEMKQIHGQPGMVMLHIHRPMSFRAAAQIVALLNEEAGS